MPMHPDENATMYDRHAFGIALKKHRERIRITQAQCAYILGISTRCYSQWETYHTGTHPLKMAGVIEKLRKLPPVKP